MTFEVEKPDPENPELRQKGRLYVCDLAGEMGDKMLRGGVVGCGCPYCLHDKAWGREPRGYRRPWVVAT